MGGQVSDIKIKNNVNEYAKSASSIDTQSSGVDYAGIANIGADMLSEYSNTDSSGGKPESYTAGDAATKIGSRAAQGLAVGGPWGALVGGVVGAGEAGFAKANADKEISKYDTKVEGAENVARASHDEGIEMQKKLGNLPTDDNDYEQQLYSSLEEQYGNPTEIAAYNRKKNGYAK